MECNTSVACKKESSSDIPTTTTKIFHQNILFYYTGHVFIICNVFIFKTSKILKSNLSGVILPGDRRNWSNLAKVQVIRVALIRSKKWDFWQVFDGTDEMCPTQRESNLSRVKIIRSQLEFQLIDFIPTTNLSNMESHKVVYQEQY